METYKNSKSAFEKQLKININELNGNYPAHWNQLLIDLDFLLKNYKIDNFIDIGCGCGATKKLLETHFPKLNYIGFDYSENAINVAKKYWGYDNFFIKDCFDFNENNFSKNDIIYMSALCDVLNNADELFIKFLSFNVNFFLFYRVRLTEKKSFFLDEIAYDNVKTFSYYHNKEELIDNITKNDYNYKININNQNSVNILLIKNKI